MSATDPVQALLRGVETIAGAIGDSVIDDMPPYAFVPGGPWPHPVSSPQGHSFGRRPAASAPIRDDAWERSDEYLSGVALFNAGYYWEAHEAWESLWHAHGRKGPIADVLKGLIKLAAAGLKVRQHQTHGIITHARRASEAFQSARDAGGPHQFGLDLTQWIERSVAIATDPPQDPAPPGTIVSRVFSFRLEPKRM